MECVEEQTTTKKQRSEASRPVSNSYGCDHKYEVLTDNINITEIRTGNDVVDVKARGYVFFYCSKCLDIKRKVIT